MGSDSSKTEHYGTPGDSIAEDSPHQELARRIEEALSRFAVHGEVRFDGNLIVLETPRGMSAIPAAATVQRWSGWSEAERNAQIAAIAKALVKKRDTGRPPAFDRGRSVPIGGIAAVIACVLFGGAGFLVWGPDTPPEALDPEARVPAVQRSRGGGALDERTERSRRVCEATKARVVRGATVNIADTDGWVVDYIALRPLQKEPIDGSAALAPFFAEFVPGQKTRLTWPLEPELAASATEDAWVGAETLRFETPLGTMEGLTLSFHGSLIDSYFREEERGRYFHLATALTQALGATHAGLAGRCEHERGYHLGSWFFGKSDAMAATSLLYTLGYRGDPPQIASPFRRPPGAGDSDGFAFANIETATEKLDRKTLSAVLGTNQGMAMGKSGDAVTLTFSFKDGSAAARASRHLARLGHIGGE